MNNLNKSLLKIVSKEAASQYGKKSKAVKVGTVIKNVPTKDLGNITK